MPEEDRNNSFVSLVFDSGRAMTMMMGVDQAANLLEQIAKGENSMNHVAFRFDNGTVPAFDIFIRGSKVTHALVYPASEPLASDDIGDALPTGFHDGVNRNFDAAPPVDDDPPKSIEQESVLE